MKKIKFVNQSKNVQKPTQKYIEIVTENLLISGLWGWWNIRKPWNILSRLFLKLSWVAKSTVWVWGFMLSGQTYRYKRDDQKQNKNWQAGSNYWRHWTLSLIKAASLFYPLCWTQHVGVTANRSGSYQLNWSTWLLVQCGQKVLSTRVHHWCLIYCRMQATCISVDDWLLMLIS